jgi:DNA repair ATPase RecN
VDQLTPDHLDQAKRELARRRAEILARHAEELKALEADQGEIDTLDEAIAAFTRKFSLRPEAAAEIVQLNQERGLRMHAPG